MPEEGRARPRSFAEAEIVRPILANILPILLSSTLLSLAVYFLTSNAAPIHRATTEVMIRIGYEYTPSPSDVGGDFQQVLFDADDVLGTEVQILSSPRVVSEAASQLSIPAEGPSPSVEGMLGRIAIQRLEGSNILSVSVIGEDPDLSLRFLEGLTNAYFKRHEELSKRSHYSGYVRDRLSALRAENEVLSRERDLLVQVAGRELPLFWDGLSVLRDDAAERENSRSLNDNLVKLRVRMSTLPGWRELQSEFDQIETAESDAPEVGTSAAPDVQIAVLNERLSSLESAFERVTDIDRTVATNTRRAVFLHSALQRDSLRKAASHNISVVTPPYVEFDSIGLRPPEKALMAGIIGILAGCALAVAAPMLIVRRG
ncbi:hypothetical protein [Tropicimonas marinistellae]|uniref:hypothetical protein n=1 Tax=Tropicimonas marinistellae TaxID=1739787 RepID=UPI00122E2448|nr:hypothetical protein [Tropicimonas marinistellae]